MKTQLMVTMVMKTNIGMSVRNRGNQDAASHHSSSTTISSSYEENLKRSLLALLKESMIMIQHRGSDKPPKSILLSIDGDNVY